MQGSIEGEKMINLGGKKFYRIRGFFLDGTYEVPIGILELETLEPLTKVICNSQSIKYKI